MGVTNKQRVTELTKKIISTTVAPETFLTTYFGKDISTATEMAFKESKMSENYAKARPRNADPVMTDVGGETILTLSGAYFHEELSLNKILTNVIGIGSVDSMNSQQMSAFEVKLQQHVQGVIDTFTRAKIVACGQMLETGIIQFRNDALAVGSTFNFKRPAGSKVDLGAGAYWGANVGSPVATQLDAVDTYFRSIGKASNEYDMILDKTALTSLTNTTFWKTSKLEINSPDVTVDRKLSKREDATYRGNVEIAGTTFHIWISNGKCLAARGSAGVLENYINPNKVVFIPTGMQIGDIVDFPIDALTGENSGSFEIGMSVADIHYWNEPDWKKSTLTRHLAQSWNIAPYQRFAIYTLQIAA